MPQTDHANSDSNKANENDASTSRAGLRWITFGCCIAFLALLFLSIYLPNLTERVKFFTTNLLSLLVLAVIVFQAYVNRRQWEAMEAQAKTSETAAKAAELSAKAAKQSAEIAAQSFAIGERPEVYIKKVEMDDLVVGRPTRMHFTFCNAGRITAHKLWVEISGSLRPADDKSVIWHIKATPDYTESIPPTHERRFLPSLPIKLTREELSGLQFGTLILLIFGVFRYEDAASREYETPFCRMYIPSFPNEPSLCPSAIRDRIQTYEEAGGDNPN